MKIDYRSLGWQGVELAGPRILCFRRLDMSNDNDLDIHDNTLLLINKIENDLIVDLFCLKNECHIGERTPSWFKFQRRMFEIVIIRYCWRLIGLNLNIRLVNFLGRKFAFNIIRNFKEVYGYNCSVIVGQDNPGNTNPDWFVKVEFEV